jgi:hypothetical protein
MGRAFGGMRVPEITPAALPRVGGQGGLHSNGNIQTDQLIAALGLTHVWTHPAKPGDGSSGDGDNRGVSGAPLRPDMMPPSSWMEANLPPPPTHAAPTHRHAAYGVIDFGDVEAATEGGERRLMSPSAVHDANAISIDDVDEEEGCSDGNGGAAVADSNEIDIDDI